MQESSTSKFGGSRKRKFPSSSNLKAAGERKDYKRVKINDARSIVTQTSDAALKNGQLDIQSFIQSREFEIKALQNGMQKSKNSLNIKSLQKVPRDMRRRTASHNVKRLPKRLRKRAEKEMKDGNTPTVTACKRKPGSSRGRIRSEIAKRLEKLAASKRALKQENTKNSKINTRHPRPKQKMNQMSQPPKSKSKFRKRQICKAWLPTHIWHAKRAKMSKPSHPLWRFALPLSPTLKSYRSTHRAGSIRGTVIWDTSYMSTVLLEGSSEGLENVLKAVGLTEDWLWEDKGSKWRNGTRSWTGWLSRCHENKNINMSPSTIFWCPESRNSEDKFGIKSKKKPSRQAFIRIHPAAFLETWTELVRLSKLQRPQTHILDLRFEIGSIELIGPGSTEALLGILHPYFQGEDSQELHAKTFTSLSGVTNPGCLPIGATLSFSIIDPRLRYPPRPIELPKSTDDEAQLNLLHLLSEWPPDNSPNSMAICDHKARLKAVHFPSQQAINFRKGMAAPGAYPTLLPSDSPIPIILLASRSNGSSASQGKWTLLAPWKCINPIWLGLVHYPLSSGGNPHFGGLQELQQITFEQKMPWFPADYPGTNSGFSWEIRERQRRKSEWEKMPKGRRVEWTTLNLGNGRKGEIGRGWCNDFESLFKIPQIKSENYNPKPNGNETHEQVIKHISGKIFNSLLSDEALELPIFNAVATVCITLLGRGVARPCARIYSLPRKSPNLESSFSSAAPATTREKWLSLLPLKPRAKSAHHLKSQPCRIPSNTLLSERVQLLAQSLLQKPPLPYPADKNNSGVSPLVPDEEDLIGFVTTGKYCLSEGSGISIGTVHVNKILRIVRNGAKKADKHRQICVVRNAGECSGWLARWEIAVDPC